MKKLIKTIGLLIPGVRRLLIERDALIEERAALFGQRDMLEKERDELKEHVFNLKSIVDGQDAPQFAPPGHFYSPIPAKEDVATYVEKFFGKLPESISAIDLRIEEQLALLEEFKDFYEEIPFPEQKTDGFRFFFENPAYSYSDAIFLYCILRHANPKQVVEVGSGYSSCVMLDTNERFFENKIDLTFIEPYPKLLISLLHETDRERISLIDQKLQDVDLNLFKKLDANDILFIDSTHVSRVNSDVNYIFAEILPALNSGVFIHFHDIFYPFEYPKPWLLENRAWTELYMLRTFLQFNDSFEIVAFNSYLQQAHKEKVEETLPRCFNNQGGSIWLRKL